MLRSYTVVVREEQGFQYAISVRAASAEKAQGMVQADLDEWGETDKVMQVLPLHSLEDSR